MSQEFEVVNQFGKLCFHRQSLRGRIQDYVISFDEKVTTAEDALNKTYDLFQQLIEKFKDKSVKARLIAKVNYVRLNEKHEEVGEEDYHFASYQLEKVENVNDFYARHMMRIVSRMDSFHQNGSRLMINAISHIHIQMSICHSASSTNS